MNVGDYRNIQRLKMLNTYQLLTNEAKIKQAMDQRILELDLSQQPTLDPRKLELRDLVVFRQAFTGNFMFAGEISGVFYISPVYWVVRFKIPPV